MLAYGAPVLKRPRLHDRGDYLLVESRRIIPGSAVRNPPRRSAVSAASILVALNMAIPPWMAEQCAAELTTGEVTTAPRQSP